MFDIAIRAHGFVATGHDAGAEMRRAEQRRALAARRVAAAGHADGEHGGGAQGGGGDTGDGGRAKARPAFQMAQPPEAEEPAAGMVPPAATHGAVQRSYAASHLLQTSLEEAGIDMLG